MKICTIFVQNKEDRYNNHPLSTNMAALRVFVVSHVYLLYLMCICCTVCIAVLTLDTGLLARSQYPVCVCS
jgi:hypothetical protein